MSSGCGGRSSCTVAALPLVLVRDSLESLRQRSSCLLAYFDHKELNSEDDGGSN